MGEHEGLSRRDVIRGAAAGGVGLALVPAGAEAQSAAPAPAGGATAAATVTGIVFEEGPARAGLPGVLVSNGRDVAVTGADGRYSLPVEEGQSVFVVKPAGYMTPVEPGTGLPLFARLHQPAGTPADLGLRYEGVAPTGPLPASVDFPLRRQDEPSRFDAILLTDPQPETDAELDFVRDDVIPALRGTPARFGLTLGDLMFDDLSLYARHNRILGTLGLPWYSVGGNHDLNYEAPDRRHARETFKRVFGATHYAFAYAEAVFVMLDDVDYLGPDPQKPDGAGKYRGHLDAAQIDFVRNLLAHVPDDRLIVVCLHIPIRTYAGSDDAENLVNRAELLKLLSGRPHTVSFSGHTHTTEHHYLGAAEGFDGPEPHHHHVLTAVSGSWWSGPYDHRGVAVADSRDGTPNGFHVLSVDGTRYTTRFVPAKEPDGRQIRVSVLSQFHDEMRRDARPGALLQPRLPAHEVGGATVVANVFDGGPKTAVTLRVGEGPAVAMARQARVDPFVAELYDRNEATKKPWVKAVPSSHVFVAKLPRGLAPGSYPLVVEAVNEYGQPISARLALEVEG